jgi:hypothetical protein
MGAICRDCADHQQEIPAVTMVGKTPVCREHWRSRMGIPKVPSALNDLSLPKPAPVFVAPAKEVKQMVKLCACGCGIETTAGREYKWGHKPKNGKTRAGGGDTSATPKRGRKPKVDASTNGHFAVTLSILGLDAIWNALPAEKKAELLGNL